MGGVLDWRDRRHWGGRRRKCRICRKLTFLLDDYGHPAHKLCVEQQIAEWAATDG
jgi:hypothetical protein